MARRKVGVLMAHFIYDADADALEIVFRDGKATRTLETEPGRTLIDMDGDEVLAIEILNPRRWPVIRDFGGEITHAEWAAEGDVLS